MRFFLIYGILRLYYDGLLLILPKMNNLRNYSQFNKLRILQSFTSINAYSITISECKVFIDFKFIFLRNKEFDLAKNNIVNHLVREAFAITFLLFYLYLHWWIRKRFKNRMWCLYIFLRWTIMNDIHCIYLKRSGFEKYSFV